MYSVIIPSKNEEDFIGNLLNKISNQTLKPSEIIVADKSTDKTRSIAKNLGAKVTEGTDDGYIGKARNNGTIIAKEEILVFMDADTYPEDDQTLEHLIKQFEEKDLDIATCLYNPDIKNIKTIVAFFIINSLKKIGSSTQNVLAEGAACMLMKKTSLQELGGFREDIKVGEEALLIRKALKEGYNYRCLPVKVTTSARRYNSSYSELINIIIAALGLGFTYIFNKSLCTPKYRRLENMYGETGGKKESSIN